MAAHSNHKVILATNFRPTLFPGDAMPTNLMNTQRLEHQVTSQDLVLHCRNASSHSNH